MMQRQLYHYHHLHAGQSDESAIIPNVRRSIIYFHNPGKINFKEKVNQPFLFLKKPIFYSQYNIGFFVEKSIFYY
jgi:hypothetical protein